MDNGKQLIPYITPTMLREEPDQVSFTLNQIIDVANSVLSKQ